MTVICPAIEIVITPPHMQFSIDELFSAGILAIITVAEPGAHGATVFGMHGAGVGTPRAAAVSAITCGFIGDVHIPNGITFIMGLLSMMFAAGVVVRTLFAGKTTSELGATPKLHAHIAPMHTCCPMIPLPKKNSS
jgi:hypothetical protein